MYVKLEFLLVALSLFAISLLPCAATLDQIQIENFLTSIPIASVGSCSSRDCHGVIDTELNQTLIVNFSIMSGSRILNPHQVALAFFYNQLSQEPPLSVVVPAVRMSKGDYETVVHFSSEQFNRKSGLYNLTILLGDLSILYPVSKEVGAFLIKFGPGIHNHVPLYRRSLLHDSDNTLTALPDIIHIVKPPAFRADMKSSAFFSVLTLLPLLLFLIFLSSTKLNSKLISSRTSLCFLFCIAVVLFLIIAYWFAIPGFSFYDTCKYLSIIAPLSTIVGHAALTHLNHLRQ